MEAVPGSNATSFFTTDGCSLSGNTGCKDYTRTYSAQPGNDLAISGMTSTRATCWRAFNETVRGYALLLTFGCELYRRRHINADPNGKWRRDQLYIRSTNSADTVLMYTILLGLILLISVIDMLVFCNIGNLSKYLDPSRMVVTEVVFGVFLGALAVKLVLDGRPI